MNYETLFLDSFCILLLITLLARDILKEKSINSRVLHIFLNKHEERVLQRIELAEKTLIRNTKGQIKELKEDLKNGESKHDT